MENAACDFYVDILFVFAFSQFVYASKQRAQNAANPNSMITVVFCLIDSRSLETAFSMVFFRNNLRSEVASDVISGVLNGEVDLNVQCKIW